MSFNGLRLKYALKGSSNYIAWKENMEEILEDNELKKFIDFDIPNPAAADAQILDAWHKKVAKVRRILLEGVQYHIFSSIHGKATPYAMWKFLKYLFQNSKDQRKLALKENLRKIKKKEGEMVPTYLLKFTQC